MADLKETKEERAARLAEEKAERSRKNSELWQQMQRENAKGPKGNVATKQADDEARKLLQKAISDSVVEVITSTDTQSEDRILIESCRVVVAKLLKIVPNSILLLEGDKQVKAIRDLVEVFLLLEGRATTITNDVTLTDSERASKLAKLAEIINKASEHPQP